MKLFTYFIAIITALFASAAECTAQVFTVTNRLDITRTDEIISIPVAQIRPVISPDKIISISIRQQDQKDYLLLQLVDNELDGKIDEILFRASIGPGETKTFFIETIKSGQAIKQKSDLLLSHALFPKGKMTMPGKTTVWDSVSMALRKGGRMSDPPVAGSMLL